MLDNSLVRRRALATKYADAIVATSFENWPDDHVEHALARPVSAVPVSCEALKAILVFPQRRFPGQVVMPSISPDAAIFSAPPTQLLFPKLGPVSWKEVPAFCNIPAADAGILMPAMFASVTARMATILDAFITLGTPTFLHLFPYIELERFIEARMTIEKRQVVAARWQRLPYGVRPDERIKASLIDFATELAQTASLPNMLLDLCLDTTEPGAAPQLLEINPDIPELRTGD